MVDLKTQKSGYRTTAFATRKSSNTKYNNRAINENLNLVIPAEKTKVIAGYLSIGSCISSLTKNQVIAFVVSIAVCFLFTVSGMPIVLNFFSSWTPQALLDTIASFSFVSNFIDLSKGVIDVRNIVYFLSLIISALTLNIISINSRKGI